MPAQRSMDSPVWSPGSRFSRVQALTAALASEALSNASAAVHSRSCSALHSQSQSALVLCQSVAYIAAIQPY